MTQMTQEEIMTNTKTVVQGLEALKNEHNSILNGLSTLGADDEKKGLVQKSLDTIELGLGEAQVTNSPITPQLLSLLLFAESFLSFFKLWGNFGLAVLWENMSYVS